MAFDFASLFRADLPPAAARWNGFPKYNFVGGHNDGEALPLDGLVEAATRVLRREGRTLAMYGLQSGPQGYRPLREFIAETLNRRTGMTCSADDVLVTSGSLQALDLINALLLAPGDTAIAEEATYGGAVTRLQRRGVDCLGVSLDDGGIRLDHLEELLSGLAAKGTKPKYVYTIPTVQNPTGTVMSEARRLDLLALARKYDVAIFEDDCYADLVWNGTRPRSIRALDTDGRVVYCGSFSKSIAPALRLGFIVADWPVMSRLLGLKTDAGTGALEQMVLAEYCPGRFDAHVSALAQKLKSKHDVMLDALGREFGTTAEVKAAQGGIFLWIALPDTVDTTKLFQAAGKEGVAINPGAEWVVDAATG
ncbi:MAG: PLP-dependent aminotransferase family protein, partial [Alphaproteobacteria bacterium]